MIFTFDDRLKLLRIAKGDTQYDVANAVGISESAYRSYENNAREPNAVVLKALAKYFGVTIDYLLNCHITNDVFTSAEIDMMHKYQALSAEKQTIISNLINSLYAENENKIALDLFAKLPSEEKEKVVQMIKQMYPE